MEPRSSLASQASGRSAVARGVHFGETPTETRGVHFGEGVENEASAAPAAVAQQVKTTPLSEQLQRELERISPQPPGPRQAQIDSVLAEALAVCRGACVELAGAGALQEEGVADALLPLGSYHLGVTLRYDEIDVLFVVPLFMQIAELPEAIFAELLRRGGAKNLTPAGSDGLLSAPGLRFELRGVRVKVLLSQRIPLLPQPRAEAIVQNMAAVFAHEASSKILSSVPNPDVFRGLLRFVRLWARQRGVYGPYLGFPGGMAWAVCCARICQMYPSIELSQLAARFFRVLSRWDWRQPLTLDGSAAPVAPPQMVASSASGALELSGSSPIMTVMLPVGAGIPATSTLTVTTMKIVQKELRRGYKMVQHVELVRAHWTDVYKEARFFQRHRHYLEFDFMATTEAIHSAWLAWSRQQLQELVQLFETMSSNIVTLRPWPEWVDFKDAEWPYATAVFLGLHLERGTGDGQQEGQRRSCDLREPIVKFLGAISAWPDAEKNANEFELLIKHMRTSELEQWLENRQKGVASSQGAAGTSINSVGNQARGGPMGTGAQLSITEEDADAAGLRECSV